MANRDVHEPKLPGVRTLKEDAVAEADDAEHLGVSFNTKSKAVPLTTPKPTQPVAGEGKAGDKALFDVGRAIDEDQLEVGSFVTDKRHKKIAFKEVAKAAFSEWWSKTSRAIKKIEAFAPAEEKPTIPKAETRKEIIQEATAHTRLAPRDDHELVVEKIKTLAHDAERVTGKSYTIKKPSVKAESTPSWSQLSETAPNQKQSSTTTAPTPKPTPTIVSNQPPQKADHLTIAPIVAKPEHRSTANEQAKTPSPTTLPKPKPLAESPKPHDEMTVIRAPRSEPQLIATPAAPYVERPHKPGLWKILTQKKGVEHNKVTVAPPIPKPLSRLTLSESQTNGGPAEMKASEFLALFKKQQASKPTNTESLKTPLPEKKPASPEPTKEAVLRAPTKPAAHAPVPPPTTTPTAVPEKISETIEPTATATSSNTAPDPQPEAPTVVKPQPETVPEMKKVVTPPRTQPTLVIPPLASVDVAPATVSPPNESSEWTAMARGDALPVAPATERPTTTPPAEVVVPPAPTPIIRVKTPPPARDKPKPPAPRLVLTGDKPYFEFEPEAPTVAPTPTAHVTRAISATPKTAKPLWTTNRLTFAMLLGVLVLIGAGAGIYTGLRHSAQEASELFAEPAEVSGFFATDRSVAVPIASTAEEMNQTVRNEIVGAPTGITHIYGVTTNENNKRQIAVATETMVKSLGWRLDSRFLRALEETMMIGSVANEPYVVLRSSNYDLAFAGMLGWESAMAADLATIFEITPRTNEGPFTDVLAQNHTLRVRTDTEGNETIVYTFLDRRTIIITSNQIALQALIAAVK